MPTPAEQKALTFVALVILLGGGVRIVRGGVLGSPSVTLPEQQALARQAFAADSVATAGSRDMASKGRKSTGKAPKRRYAGAKFDSAGVLIQGTGVADATVSPLGFPPPGPRIDVDFRAPRPAGAPVGSTPLIDLDVADAAQVGQLPRIGPALARRIVASRDSLGPFGSLAALRRVKGVGPATLERLAGLVTFSGQARR